MIALDDLNPNQRRAVEWDTGPLLVLAGLGSGKTVVLALRVVRLAEENEHASALALTFTNKAACRDPGTGGPKGTGAPRPEGRPAPARTPRGGSSGAPSSDGAGRYGIASGGRTGRVNVEVASDRYGAQQLGRKITAGFRIHTTGARAERMVARLRSGGTEL